MKAIEAVATALFIFDRDKDREFDVFGVKALLYGDPPCEFGDLAEIVKGRFRDQAKVAISALDSYRNG